MSHQLNRFAHYNDANIAFACHIDSCFEANLDSKGLDSRREQNYFFARTLSFQVIVKLSLFGVNRF